MFKILLYLVIGYFVYRFVMAFLSGFNGTKSQPTDGSDKGKIGEYIDFEEVKDK